MLGTHHIDTAIPGDGNDRFKGSEIDTCRRQCASATDPAFGIWTGDKRGSGALNLPTTLMMGGSVQVLLGCVNKGCPADFFGW